MTLRQALAVLRSAGFIETRRGRGGGSFVREVELPSPVAGRSRRRRCATSPTGALRSRARPPSSRPSGQPASERDALRRLAVAVETVVGDARRLPARRRAPARCDRRGGAQPPARLGRDAAAGRARRGARARARSRARAGDVAGRARADHRGDRIGPSRRCAGRCRAPRRVDARLDRRTPARPAGLSVWRPVRV